MDVVETLIVMVESDWERRLPFSSKQLEKKNIMGSNSPDTSQPGEVFKSQKQNSLFTQHTRYASVKNRRT